MTQLGVTYYEQGRYREALAPLLDSLKIIPDCPLTLWNVAGVLAALNKPETALPIYTWLLRRKQTPDDDPCWESEEWTDSLKADCVYRVGACLQQMGQWESAEHAFRQYSNLILAGMKGTYSIENTAHHISDLHRIRQQSMDKELRAAIKSMLQDPGVQFAQGKQRKLPKIVLPELLAN